MTSANQQYVIC